jgi:aminopeptidase N
MLQVPDDAELVVLSNTEEASRTPVSGNRVAVAFAPTPIMSPYLVALAVGAMEEAVSEVGAGRRLSAASTGEYEVHGWAAAGRQSNMADAAVVMEKALEFYTEYFNFTQPILRVRVAVCRYPNELA